MPSYHILNGDCLVVLFNQTNINQDIIICRECLIDGNVHADSIADFWKTRAKFIGSAYNISTEEYFSKTVSEFEKLNHLPDNSEICLWFENDLFCQINMWFIISLLAVNPTHKIFRVFPVIENNDDIWKGFGNADIEKLEQAYNSKIQFGPEDIELGKNLWTAYKNSDLVKLKELSKTKSSCFKYLEEVCQAHIDRFPIDKSSGRPEKTIKEIIENTSGEFESVFSEFNRREGIYGLGDLQIKKIYDRLLSIR
ncbi:MAG: DUF1835 domain-containing protein [Ignavibacteria bacterium]|nr:DUF1835 domain-containing protein [Ignavibacteria bacterium]